MGLEWDSTVTNPLTHGFGGKKRGVKLPLKKPEAQHISHKVLSARIWPLSSSPASSFVTKAKTAGPRAWHDIRVSTTSVGTYTHWRTTNILPGADDNTPKPQRHRKRTPPKLAAKLTLSHLLSVCVDSCLSRVLTTYNHLIFILIVRKHARAIVEMFYLKVNSLSSRLKAFYECIGLLFPSYDFYAKEWKEDITR